MGQNGTKMKVLVLVNGKNDRISGGGQWGKITDLIVVSNVVKMTSLVIAVNEVKMMGLIVVVNVAEMIGFIIWINVINMTDL